MFSHGDAAVDLFSARAAASRANGAKSKGPRTAEGKARASQNALKHGMCAKKFLLLPYDSRAEFAALESALLEDLRPEGALETLLARRLIAAAWRLARADRLECEMLLIGDPLRSPGRVPTRDAGAERAFATLVRDRNGAQPSGGGRPKGLLPGEHRPRPAGELGGERHGRDLGMRPGPRGRAARRPGDRLWSWRYPSRRDGARRRPILPNEPKTRSEPGFEADSHQKIVHPHPARNSSLSGSGRVSGRFYRTNPKPTLSLASRPIRTEKWCILIAPEIHRCPASAAPPRRSLRHRPGRACWS
jgi:hypothetical protein